MLRTYRGSVRRCSPVFLGTQDDIPAEMPRGLHEWHNRMSTVVHQRRYYVCYAGGT